MNLETTISQALHAALEAHHSDYCQGMWPVVEALSAALDALDGVSWGIEEEHPDIEYI